MLTNPQELVSRRSRLVEQEVPEEVHLGALAVEAEVVVLLVEGEVSQAAGVHQEEAQEVSVQARTEGLQEGEEEALVVVVEAIKLMLRQCLHVVYAAFREYPQRLCGWLDYGTGIAVSRYVRAKRCKIIFTVPLCIQWLASLNSGCKYQLSAQKLLLLLTRQKHGRTSSKNHKPDPRKECWPSRVQVHFSSSLPSQLPCIRLFPKLLFSVGSRNLVFITPHTLRHVTKIRRSQCRH